MSVGIDQPCLRRRVHRNRKFRNTPPDFYSRPMITITQRQRTFASYASDILIYVIVLNLFVEYIDNVIIDSFTISVFTAVVLRM